MDATQTRAGRRIAPGLWAAGVVVLLLGFVGIGSGLPGDARHVQADSGFCLDCHALEAPNEALAASGHEDIDCVACHVPGLDARGRTVLTVLAGGEGSAASPGDLEVGCRACHVEASEEPSHPITDLAVHRVHLESDRLELAELECAACHVSDVHAMSPTDEGCSASGCHEDNAVRLGAMAHEVMSCSDCHAATTLPSDRAEGVEALEPTVDQCLSCHAMQDITDVPEHDPHGGQCAMCHLPHEHETAAAANSTCADAGCHTEPSELSGTHQGLAPGVLSDCAACHSPHDFRAEGQDCRACHQDLFEPGGAGQTAHGSLQPGGAPGAAIGGFGVGMSRLPLRQFALLGHTRPAAHGTTADDDRFRHIDHEDVECTSCHAATEDEPHGRLTVVTQADCRSCHHTEEAGVECLACHEEVDGSPQVFAHDVSFALSVWERGDSRSLEFTHGRHATEDCASCHTASLTLLADSVTCNSCHEEHHTTEVTCASCHVQAPDEAHPVESHIGCAGVGCHTSNPMGVAPRDNAVCLGCHQDLEPDHKPGRECVSCHLMPAPGTPWVSHVRGGGS